MVDRKKIREKVDALSDTLKEDNELYQVLCGIHLILTPVPAEMEGGNTIYYFVCGECHGIVDTNDRFCKHCGTQISWVGE